MLCLTGFGHIAHLLPADFAVFQYFVSIVPTNYIDSRGRKLQTNQYSVTDYTRTVQHGEGVPGIFIKFDIEAVTLTLKQRTISFVTFLVRLAGIIGGVWVCAGYTLRVGDKAAKAALKVIEGSDGRDETEYADAFTSAYSTTPRRSSRASDYSSIYNSTTSGGMDRSASWYGKLAGGADTGGEGFASPAKAVSGAFAAARGAAGQAWDAGVSTLGPKHRKTESLAQKMMCEEGRSW